MKPQEPWSTATGLAYLPAGYIIYEVARTPEAAVVGLGLALLGAGTAYRHWAPSRRSSKVDQYTMHLALGSMALVGAGVPALAAAALAVGIATVIEWQFDLHLRVAMGLYVAVLFIEAAVLVSWWVPLVAAGPMGGGLYARDRLGGDLFHGVAWHLGALAGLLVLAWAVL